jgi:hypothetical protein
MTKPVLEIDADPSLGGKIYYLPLGPKSKDHAERYKVCVRLKITNRDTKVGGVKITGIAFGFPGRDEIEMDRVPEKNMTPEDGRLANGQTASWYNGSWRENDDDGWQQNQVYLDGPVPKQMTIKVVCAGFTEPYSQTFELIRWGNPTGDGPLLLPFARHELDDDEYVVTSAVHGYNGVPGGTQLYAYDISIQARLNGEWSRNRVANPTKNTDSRIFGRPLRAMGHGEVIAIDDGFGPGPYHSTDEGFWDNEFGAGNRTDHYGSNEVWVRYGNIEVRYSHLKRGSIAVEKGDIVWPGRKLAEAGNSGNTKGSPHLHMECRIASYNTLCGMTFKHTWQLARDLVPQDNGTGRRVRLEDQGICQEKAALRPFATRMRPVDPKQVDVELVEIVAEIFGGAAKGGDGFAIVNGKIIRIPPRGIKNALLKAIAEIDASEELGRVQAKQRLGVILGQLKESLAKIPSR